MDSKELRRAKEYEMQYEPFITDRPAFHLTPRIGWMNDPNGFSFYQGKYHIFYQYHPYDVKWGPMHWGHAVSTDLLRWGYLPCALAPDMPYDSDGCFSGSAMELPDGRHLIMYTGVQAQIREDGLRQEFQAQCVAIGDGVNYQKIPENPVITADTLPEGGSPHDFRDPKIWREADGSYACVMGNRPADGSGSILLYRSDDAVHWHFDCIVDQCWNEFGKMWECPELFPLDGKHVLLVSPQDMQPSGLEFHNGNGNMCIIGQFNPDTKTFEREDIQAIDYGLDFYATQTLLTSDGRRIMIAWMQNWDACVPSDRERRWFGQLTLPRELSIRDSRLIQQPVRELEALRGRRVMHRLTLGEESSLQGVYGRTIDMTVKIAPNADTLYQLFRMKVACGGQHYTMITYKPHTSVLRIDRSHSGLCRDMVHERKCLVRSQQGAIQLRVILDRYSMEIFVNDGEQVLSAVIYTPLTADGISFEVQGQAQMEVEKYELCVD